MATASRPRSKRLERTVPATDLERIVLLSWDERPPVLVYAAPSVELAKAFMDGFNFCQDGGAEIGNLVLSRAVTAAEVLNDPAGHSLPKVEGGAN